MILNSIFLALEYREFPQDIKLRVNDQSRHITYYLQRKLKDLKFRSNEFNRIVISLSEIHPEEVHINSESVASTIIKFSLKDFLDTPPLEIQDYYKENIEKGLATLNRSHQIPIDDFLRWLKELKSLNYKNEWVYQEKSFRAFGVKAQLECNLNMESFELSLLVEKNGEVLYNSVVLQTPPDDVAFHYKFKDLALDGDNLVITSRVKGDKPIFSLPVSKL